MLKFTKVIALVLTSSFLALLPTVADAQLYSTINKRRVDYFYTPDPIAPNQLKMVRLKVDFIDQVASDSIMNVGPEFNGSTRLNNQNPSCPKTQSRTWVGDAVSKRFRDNVFINEGGWAFNLKWNVSLGSTYQFNSYNTDSIKMTLTLTSIELNNYFGRPDSVRIYTINRSNGQGGTIPHPFNGKTMILSKNYGWIKAYGMNKFPYDTNAYWRAATTTPTMPYQTLKSSEIYGMAAGDEYHIVTFCRACAIPGPIKYLKRKVLAVNTSNFAQVTFTFGDSTSVGNGVTNYAATSQTINWGAVKYLDSATFALITRGTSRPYNRVIGYQRAEAIAGRLKVVDTAVWAEDMTTLAGCYRRPANGGVANYRYFEKAGGPWAEWSGQTDELVYITNSSGTRGAPIYLGGTVVSLASMANKVQQLALYPNPADTKVTLRLPTNTEVLSVRAYGANGQAHDFGKATTIDITTLPKGIYNLIVSTNLGQFGSRLVVR